MMTKPLMIAKSALFAVSSLIALPLVGVDISTADAAVDIDCSVPLNVECTVTEPQGIQSITVQLQTGFGPVNVVEETYNCVTSATVSWDPIVPGGDIMVTTCGGILPPQPAGAYAQEAVTHHLKDGVLKREVGRGALDVRRPGLNYMLRAPVQVVQAALSSRVLQMLPLLGTYNSSGTTATLADTSMCCNEGTFEGCFGVNLLAQCGEGLDFVHCFEDESAGQSLCEVYEN
ncbi:MAG: hypothetical protein Tsb0020_44120 [Haliangiales bacterium]